MASTKRKELVESNAWLINIQKLDNNKLEYPLIIQIVNQCISTTVEYATSFFKSIWKNNLKTASLIPIIKKGYI